MDAGCYCAHSLRFFSGCSKPKVRVVVLARKVCDVTTTSADIDRRIFSALCPLYTPSGAHNNAQVESAAASKLMDGGAIDGRMTATLSFPSSSSSSSSGVLAAGAVGRMQADLRHEGWWPSTLFSAVGTK
jgi:hypothetical protein